MPNQISQEEKIKRSKKIYEKYVNILNNLKRKQDTIINKYAKKRDDEEIEKIRKKLFNKQ